MEISAGSSFQSITATRSWVEATGATSLAFDASAPGYKPEWQVPLTAPYHRLFAVFDVAGTVESDTQLDENVTP